jgi:hypothetical protein
MLQGLNWAGIIAALVVTQAMSWFWYGKLFADRLTIPLAPQATTPAGYAEGALFSLIMLTGAAWVIKRTGNDNLVGGVTTAFILWFAFLFMSASMEWLYAGRSITMIEIDGGFSLVYMLVAGALIGGLKLTGKRTAP